MISVRTRLNYLAIIRGQNIVSLFPSNLSGFEKLIMGLTRIGIKKKKKKKSHYWPRPKSSVTFPIIVELNMNK